MQVKLLFLLLIAGCTQAIDFAPIGYTLDSKDSNTYTFVDDENIIKIKILQPISQKDSKILESEQIQTIKAIYGAEISPYPGEISNQIVCNEKFQPIFETQNNITLVSMYATQRLTYGACTEDLIAYKAGIAWYWCSESLYVIQEFKRSEDVSFIRNFVCPLP